MASADPHIPAKQASPEVFLGTHCSTTSQMARLGVNDHTKCPGGWVNKGLTGSTDEIQCSCACHTNRG